MKTQVKTLEELRRLKGIKVDEIWKIISKQTYYNWIKWSYKPQNTEITERICKLFEIDKETFDYLLKNTIKNFNS